MKHANERRASPLTEPLNAANGNLVLVTLRTIVYTYASVAVGDLPGAGPIRWKWRKNKCTA